MCGICGVLGLEDRHLLKAMTNIMQHRGPDDSSSHIDEGIMLGHRRLSIIDLSEKGKQPMHNEDCSITLVANGEIYNFDSIKDELQERGHRFSSETDIEVIIHAYEEHGESCVKDFNGMFAFALWDSNRKKLLLARDRHGQKPLYYTFCGDEFLFASELKSLLTYEKVKRILDFESVHYFLNLRFLPGENTMFKNIKRLRAGHTMTVGRNGEATTRRYWRPQFVDENRGIGYYVTALRKALRASVERHMISDVPVGIYLSGGLDSSSILAAASEVTEEPIRTFTMGFGEERDEVRDAELVASHFDTDHRSIIIRANILKDYPRMIWHVDCPKRNLYTFYLSQFMSNYVKVALGGLGGDELFGGYTWKYVTANVVLNARKKLRGRLKDEIVRSARRLHEYQSTLGLIEDDRFMEYLKKLRFVDSNVDLYLMVQTLDEVFSDVYLRKKLYSRELLKRVREPYESIVRLYREYFDNERHIIDQFMMADYSVKMQDDFLFVEDAMSMANSLESRGPFLDNEIVELSFRTPFKYKIFNVMDSERGAHVGKYLLRKAVEGRVPKSVLAKSKQGFGTDVFKTYTSEIKDFAGKLLPEGDIVGDGLIRGDYINEVLGHYDSRNLIKHYCLIWNLVTLEIWYQMYMKGDDIAHPRLRIESYLK